MGIPKPQLNLTTLALFLASKWLKGAEKRVVSGHRYYSPELGRWMNRDPIGELGLNALMRRNGEALHGSGYRMVANAPVGRCDYLGLYTMLYALTKAYQDETGDKEPSVPFSEEHSEWQSRYGSWRAGLSKSERFEYWYDLERTRGEWWIVLPKCPPRLCWGKDGKPVCPDTSKWRKPKVPGNLERWLHYGKERVKWSLRSRNFSGHSNQCTYDASLTLLRDPPEAGSADWRAPVSFLYDLVHLFPHRGHDVTPAIVAGQADGNAKSTVFWGKLVTAGAAVRKYYEVRPVWAEAP